MQRPWCWDVTKRVVGCCRTDPWKPLGREPRQARSRAGRCAAWRHRSVCCARMRGFNARACPGRGRDEADRRSGLRRTRFRLAGPLEPETRGEPFGSRHRMNANAPRAPRRDKHCDPWRTVQPRRTRSSRKSSDRIEWRPSPSTAALSERTARRAMGHASVACTDVAGRARRPRVRHGRRSSAASRGYQCSSYCLCWSELTMRLRLVAWLGSVASCGRGRPFASRCARDLFGHRPTLARSNSPDDRACGDSRDQRGSALPSRSMSRAATNNTWR